VPRRSPFHHSEPISETAIETLRFFVIVSKHERTIALVVAPDALRLRVGGGAAEHVPEHLERRVHPGLLIDGRRPVTLNARDEEDHQDALAPAAQDLLPCLGLLCTGLRHARSI